MNWASSSLLAIPLLLALPEAGHALTRVSGPVQIGPSTATGDAQHNSATLATVITNRGALPDRLNNIACPGAGTASLLNGKVQPVDPGSNVQRNGLELPGASNGQATPIQAQFSLTNPAEPITPGTLLPCALYFEHAGQRIVIFTVGVHETEANEP